jgi:excisionase family DNA binding protein
MTSDDLRTLTVEEVAELLGVRPEAVRIWVREGELEAMRWGRRLRIRSEAVVRFQEGRRVGVPDASASVRRLGRARRAARDPSN